MFPTNCNLYLHANVVSRPRIEMATPNARILTTLHRQVKPLLMMLFGWLKIIINTYIYLLLRMILRLLSIHLCIKVCIFISGSDKAPAVMWGTSQLTIRWDDVIKADAPIYYEVSLGSQVGSSSIRRWAVVMETMNPFIIITDDRLMPTTDYFLSLTGVTYSGLSLSINYMITGDDVVVTSL